MTQLAPRPASQRCSSPVVVTAHLAQPPVSRQPLVAMPPASLLLQKQKPTPTHSPPDPEPRLTGHHRPPPHHSLPQPHLTADTVAATPAPTPNPGHQASAPPAARLPKNRTVCPRPARDRSGTCASAQQPDTTTATSSQSTSPAGSCQRHRECHRSTCPGGKPRVLVQHEPDPAGSGTRAAAQQPASPTATPGTTATCLLPSPRRRPQHMGRSPAPSPPIRRLRTSAGSSRRRQPTSASGKTTPAPPRLGRTPPSKLAAEPSTPAATAPQK